MKMTSWVLLVLSVVFFLIGALSKMTGTELLYLPVAWWRASIAFVVYAMALSVLGRDGRV